MRRLEVTIIIIIGILAFSVLTKAYQLLVGKPEEYAILNLTLVVVLLVFSIIWFRQIRSRKLGAKPLTVVFIGIPVLAALGQIYYIWKDDEEIVFKIWVTFCIAAVAAIYLRYSSGWIRNLFETNENNKR